MSLNLARKWRPQKFSEVVGQSMSVRMLKNGLYLKKYFPLYIFAGQRGCGKTSTARIFASALNCELLEAFQKNPKSNDIPCGKCSSCIAMLDQKHPDFIEMDAASHTGVDNVRQILESASFVPLSGTSKIYLIDEAHMLSRAAFNAFLKILEEPPTNVFFVLATTELHKIPDTVRSRAFQVFFNAIDSDTLGGHLKNLCEKENVKVDRDALSVIISESGGSARDAINLLERVRLLGDVTSDVVLEALGKISEGKLFELFNILIEKDSKKLLQFLHSVSFEKLSPQSLWDMLVSLCRMLVWIKHGLTELPPPFDRSLRSLERLAVKISLNRVNAIMQLFLTQEELFLKTSQKHLFLETVLLQICGQINIVDLEELINRVPHSASNDSTPSQERQSSSNNTAPKNTNSLSVSNDTQPRSVVTPLVNINTQGAAAANASVKIAEEGSSEQITPAPSSPKMAGPDETWGLVVEAVSGAGDPLLESVFRQSKFMGVEGSKVTLGVAGAFFKDKLLESDAIIRPIIKKYFADFEGFSFQNVTPPRQSKVVSRVVRPSTKVDISDKAKWPKANLLASHFSGRIERVVK